MYWWILGSRYLRLQRKLPEKPPPPLLRIVATPNHLLKCSVLLQKKLTSSLSCCFVSKQTIKAMWGHYHTLRSSDSVRSDWITFVQESVCRTPSHSPFQWCMLTASTDDDNAAVLHRIIELYVTTRVFICKLMLYKKSSKRALQKGKGIHKELFTSKIYNTMS